MRIRSLALLGLLAGCGGGERDPQMRLVAQLDLQTLTEGAPFASGSGNWGYTAPDGRRLALTGTSEGLAVSDVTTARRPVHVALVRGPRSAWREVRTYRHYAYVTTEAIHGLDIVDLSDPARPRKVRTWDRTFSSAHTLWIDEARGLLYANGTRDAQRRDSGMRVLDLRRDPLDPTEVGNFRDYYVHDSHARGGRLYAAAIYGGFVGVLDVSEPARIREIARFRTGGAFTHNAWPTDDGRHLFTTDEVFGRPVQGWDVSNLAAPRLVSEYISRPDSLPHNVLVDGNRLLIAHYAEGVHMLDISDPAAPVKLASLDPVPGPTCGAAGPGARRVTPLAHPDHADDDHGQSVFCGTWSAYVFPGTGHILASDMEGGLFVIEYSE
jgi:choice-of-anchor B domain-containing protein